YASTEGLTGSSRPDEVAIAFAEDGCIVELVDDDNRPVPPGTPSAKVLVTNLYNRVQPLIRYDITARFVADPPAPTGPGHRRPRGTRRPGSWPGSCRCGPSGEHLPVRLPGREHRAERDGGDGRVVTDHRPHRSGRRVQRRRDQREEAADHPTHLAAHGESR